MQKGSVQFFLPEYSHDIKLKNYFPKSVLVGEEKSREVRKGSVT